jgi:hypothetical protein
MSSYNGSQRIQINKQAVAGTKRYITLTIPERLEIIRKPGSATSYSVIIAVHIIGLVIIYGIKKQVKINC